MKTLEEARDTLQISQEDIDFLVEGVRRAREPLAIIAYGSQARGEAEKNSDYDILGLSELTGKELKEFSISAHVQLRRFGRDLDFFIGNIDDFRAAIQHGRSFATEVDRDGVILYGTVEARGFMNERDLSNYQTILERCDDVIAKLERIGYSNEIWKRNRMVRDSILFSLSQVGELVSHFKTDEYKELFPEIPWRKIKKQRDYISCWYADKGYETAWKAAIDDVPAIRKSLLSNEEISHSYDIDRECAEYESGFWSSDLVNLRIGRPGLTETMKDLGEGLDGADDAMDDEITQ